MMWEDGVHRKLLVHWMLCLCKGQPYYVDIGRAQWPKQACQPRQASICQGYGERGQSR